MQTINKIHYIEKGNVTYPIDFMLGKINTKTEIFRNTLNALKYHNFFQWRGVNQNGVILLHK